MNHINSEQRNAYRFTLGKICNTDPTYQYLKKCVDGLSADYLRRIPRSQQKQFRECLQAADTLCVHYAYLAYKLGLEHGSNGWLPVAGENTEQK